MAHTGCAGTGTERCDQQEPFDPCASAITGHGAEKAPRLTAGWQALRELLRDHEPHTWSEAIAAITATGLKYKTAVELIRKGISLGYLDSTHKRHSHRNGARYSNRKVWLA